MSKLTRPPWWFFVTCALSLLLFFVSPLYSDWFHGPEAVGTEGTMDYLRYLPVMLPAGLILLLFLGTQLATVVHYSKLITQLQDALKQSQKELKQSQDELKQSQDALGKLREGYSLGNSIRVAVDSRVQSTINQRTGVFNCTIAVFNAGPTPFSIMAIRLDQLKLGLDVLGMTPAMMAVPNIEIAGHMTESVAFTCTGNQPILAPGTQVLPIRLHRLLLQVQPEEGKAAWVTAESVASGLILTATAEVKT